MRLSLSKGTENYQIDLSRPSNINMIEKNTYNPFCCHLGFQRVFRITDGYSVFSMVSQDSLGFPRVVQGFLGFIRLLTDILIYNRLPDFVALIHCQSDILI